jgi:hypothetical protein
MGKDWKEPTSYTMTPKEMEKLLQHDFGDKLLPVNTAKLLKQQQQRARYRDNKCD